jgi:hypothetical protein
MQLKRDLLQGPDGLDRLVIFGGRTLHKLGLNDAWEATLSWPNATWRLISPQQPGAEGVPSPRKGHTAVLVGNASSPQMVSSTGGWICLLSKMTGCIDIRAIPRAAICWQGGIRT